VFAGIAVPPLAALLRPLLVPAIVVPFLIALIRMDWGRLVGNLRQPGETASAALWLLLAAPLLVHAFTLPLALPAPIHAGMVLVAVVTAMLTVNPGFVFRCAAAAYVLDLCLQGLGTGIFAWRGRQRALTPMSA
jgi:hypothetical protein